MFKGKALVGRRHGRGSSCSSAIGLLASVSRRRLIHPQDGRRLSSSPFGLRQKRTGLVLLVGHGPPRFGHSAMIPSGSSMRFEPLRFDSWRGRGSSCRPKGRLRALCDDPFGLIYALRAPSVYGKKDGARLARRPWASSLRSLRRVWCAHRADAAELRAPSVYQIKKSERPLDVLIFLVHLQGLEPWTP